jgi:cytochrome c-type biogenesis protein CcmF
MRIYYKPFVRWIWGGSLLMMLGGFVAASDRRYRLVRAGKTVAVDTGLHYGKDQLGAGVARLKVDVK